MQIRSFFRASMLGACLIAPLAANAMTANEFAALSHDQRKQLPLELKLQFARPMPDPPAPVRASETDGERLYRHDGDGSVRVEPSTRSARRDDAHSHPGVAPGRTMPHALGANGDVDATPPAADSGEGVDTAVPGPAVTATPPQPLYYTYAYPFSTFVKLLIGFDGDYFVCSATLIHRYFLLTAGHCVYNHDPNEDGNGADAQWADEAYIFPGQTDLQPPFSATSPVDGQPEHPFGEAIVLQEWAYSGWIDNGNLYYDQAFMRIDRPMGDVTGWLGVETNVAASSLNFSGYPVETPYVPWHTFVQYPGYDAGNVSGYADTLIALAAYTYGGHSGGPVWRYDGTNRWLQGMNSTSNRQGSATAARVTNQVFEDLFAQVDTPRPENLYADLVMWTRWTAPLANLYTPAIHPGESLEFDYTVGNAGFASSGDITTSFFLVGGPCFSGYFIDCFIAQPVYAGVYLDTQQFPPLAGNSWYWPRARIDTPAALAPGLYWVAWYSTGAAPEYYSGTSSACAPYCNNQGGIAAVPLVVADDGQLADLSVRGVDVQPRYALQGTLAEVTATVDNTGTFPTRPATVRIAIAAGGACAAATALATLPLDALQPGDSRAIGATVRVPWNTPVGTAHICVDADDEDEVRESDETNNGASLQIFVDYNEQIFANGFDGD